MMTVIKGCPWQPGAGGGIIPPPVWVRLWRTLEAYEDIDQGGWRCVGRGRLDTQVVGSWGGGEELHVLRFELRKVLVGQTRGLASARRALQEPDGEQERFHDVHDGVRFLIQRRR